jgi:pimeloyl-ACP methyl ester carboxylesterase
MMRTTAIIAGMEQGFGSVNRADGRTVAYVDGGDPGGYPVIGLHGTPGCRLSRWPDESLYARAGIRYITTDRAGYGRSSRNHGRSVADEPADVLAVADALALRRFSVVGGSGGGPHALACAALLADRLDRVACQSGLAPLGAGGLTRSEWVGGMGEEIAAELAWAEAGEEVLTHEMRKAQQLMEERIATDPGSLLGTAANATDVGFLERPETLEAFRRIIPEQAVNGVGGSVDDTLAFVREWGFELSTIRVPVLITYGDDDTSLPVAHGRFLAGAVPDALVIETTGGGHFADDPIRDILDTHVWLATGRPPHA